MRASAILLMAICAGLACNGPRPTPSDDALLEQFKRVRPQLDALVQENRASVQDFLGDLRTNDIEAISGALDFKHYAASDKDAEAYRQKLRGMNVLQVGVSLRAPANESYISFVVFERGLHAESQKGFAWFESPPQSGLLDALDARPHPGGEKFRHIADNWYLFRR